MTIFATAIRRARRTRANSAWLAVETLESRLLLATVHWNTDSDGFWDDAANWLDESGAQRVPDAGDEVMIDRGAANPKITVRDNRTVGSLDSRERLELAAGTLAVSAASQIDGSLTLDGGTLNALGAVTISGSAVWSAGFITGAGGVTNTGTMTLTGNGNNKFVDATTFTNRGTITDTDDSNGALRLSNFVNGLAGMLTNEIGGLFDFAGDGTVTDSGAFNNAGTVRKSAGARTVVAVPLNNTGGTIDVRSGTLVLAGNGNSVGGTFTVEPGAELDLTNPFVNNGTINTFAGSFTGSGAGTVALRVGRLIVGAGGATFNFPPGMFQWTGGAIDGGNTLTNTGSITTSGDGLKMIADSTTLVNSGTITDGDTSNGELRVQFIGGRPGLLDNLAGGLFDIAGDGVIGGVGTIKNAGVLRKSAGAGSTILPGLANAPGGSVQVSSGFLTLLGDGHSTGGTFQILPGATLFLTGGAATGRSTR